MDDLSKSSLKFCCTKKSKTSVVIVILGIPRPLLFDIDLSVAFEGADDDLVGAVGQMRKLYKINEGMFNIDM